MKNNTPIERLIGAISVGKNDSNLVKTVAATLKKTVNELSLSELRLLAGQKIALELIIDRIIEELSRDPLLDATFYEGDLLLSVMRIPKEFWSAHKLQRVRIIEICEGINQAQFNNRDSEIEFEELFSQFKEL